MANPSWDDRQIFIILANAEPLGDKNSSALPRADDASDGVASKA